jgi:hypothetical protein
MMRERRIHTLQQAALDQCHVLPASEGSHDQQTCEGKTRFESESPIMQGGT